MSMKLPHIKNNNIADDKPEHNPASLNPDILFSRYLTQSVVLEELPLPGILKFTVLMVSSILVVFIGWASITNIKEMASASGQIIPSGYIQTVQHLEGGIIKEISIQEGEIVQKGQPLMKLDNTNAKADLGQMQARKNALTLHAARLRVFISDHPEKDPHLATLNDEEKKILASMVNAREGQRNILRDQLSQKEKELNIANSTRAALEKNVSLMQKEYNMRRDLAKNGYGPELLSIASERDLNQMQGQLSESFGRIKSAHGAIEEIKSRLTSLDADLKQDAMKNLGQMEGDIAEVSQSIDKYTNTVKRTVITAPVRGIVKGLSVHSIGTVVEPGKVILEIVPLDKDLIAEALISPSDVGHLVIGQEAQIKISAFEFARYGSVSGKLIGVSASTFQSQDGHSFYKARIKLDNNYIGKDPAKNLILPGMVVQAEIITGQKTLLQYLLKPIHVAVASSFHEH